jgi:hypothetical protein
MLGAGNHLVIQAHGLSIGLNRPERLLDQVGASLARGPGGVDVLVDRLRDLFVDNVCHAPLPFRVRPAIIARYGSNTSRNSGLGSGRPMSLSSGVTKRAARVEVIRAVGQIGDGSAL